MLFLMSFMLIYWEVRFCYYLLPALTQSHLCLFLNPHSFQVYDADSYARSRYHLLQRSPSNQTVSYLAGNNLTFGNLTISNSTIGKATLSSTPALPGAPGRWRLLPDLTGLNSYARMLRQVDLMTQTYTLYYFLQVCMYGYGT